MRPRIDATDFGSITVEGTVFDHDVVISPDGEVSKRKKKLSKAVYGTSHTISLEEARERERSAPSCLAALVPHLDSPGRAAGDSRTARHHADLNELTASPEGLGRTPG
jgi:hypothetical protein